MTPQKVSVAWNIAAGLGVLILLSSPIPNKSGPHGISPKSKAENQIKQLLLACRVYAADREGKYPLSLEALYPDYIDEKKLFHMLNEEGEPVPITFHGASIDDRIEKPLLEWPVPIDGRRIVGFTEGHITAVK